MTEGKAKETEKAKKDEIQTIALVPQAQRWHVSVVEMAISVALMLMAIGLGVIFGRAINLMGAGEVDQATEMAETETEVQKEEKISRTEAKLLSEKLALGVERPVRLRVAMRNGKKLVALTFDDGPSPETTPRLLDILREKQVKVTFFVVGRMVEAAPEVAKREVSEGHEVESHTMAHTNLATLGADAIRDDMSAMRGVIEGKTGAKMQMIRPPYGAGARDAKVLGALGVPVILWTVDTLDWKNRDAGLVRQNAVKDAFDGAIILMHDIHPTTVDAVAGTIDDLRAQGYELVTVQELAELRGLKLENSAVYGAIRPE